MAGSDMKLITCKMCGTVMMKLSRDICPICHQKEEEFFIRLKDFIRTNPNCTVEEVATALNAPPEKIDAFINSGRLERTGVHFPHACQTCHRIITTGLICGECSDKIKKQVADLKKSITDKREQGNDSVWKKKDDGDDKHHRGKSKG
jgi:RNA polymerase subunit RPABC4/transcription elongation factor Spt4